VTRRHLEFVLALGPFVDIHDADDVFVPAEMPKQFQLTQNQLSLRGVRAMTGCLSLHVEHCKQASTHAPAYTL